MSDRFVYAIPLPMQRTVVVGAYRGKRAGEKSKESDGRKLHLDD